MQLCRQELLLVGGKSGNAMSEGHKFFKHKKMSDLVVTIHGDAIMQDKRDAIASLILFQ